MRAYSTSHAATRAPADHAATGRSKVTFPPDRKPGTVTPITIINMYPAISSGSTNVSLFQATLRVMPWRIDWALHLLYSSCEQTGKRLKAFCIR